MHFSRNRRRTSLFALLLLACIAVCCAAFSRTDRDDFDSARREILLRRIGHELLLQSGDSTSRVLPVKKIAENGYQIRFEKALAFQTDSLVRTTQRLLAKDPLARDYVVNVLHCGNAGVAYGYAISKNKKDDIITCIGRRQPRACYRINITFQPTGLITAKHGYLLGSLSVLAFIGCVVLRPVKPSRIETEAPAAGLLTLGAVLFDAKHRELLIHGNTIGLTVTETRVLLIFALSPNEIIARSRLQKEIWEDDGVIVGRSLDMFISKLRKKLAPDPTITIAVVRGKGYKLEVGA